MLDAADAAHPGDGRRTLHNSWIATKEHYSIINQNVWNRRKHGAIDVSAERLICVVEENANENETVQRDVNSVRLVRCPGSCAGVSILWRRTVSVWTAGLLQVLQLASRKLSASGHRAILEPGELRLQWPRPVSRRRGKSEPETFGQLKLRSEPVQLPRFGAHARRLKIWPNVGTAVPRPHASG